MRQPQGQRAEATSPGPGQASLPGQARRRAAARGPHCSVTVAGPRDGTAAGADRTDTATRLHGGHEERASGPRRPPRPAAAAEQEGARPQGSPATRPPRRAQHRPPGDLQGRRLGPRQPEAPAKQVPALRRAPRAPTRAPEARGAQTEAGEWEGAELHGRAARAPESPGPARRLPGRRAGGGGQGGQGVQAVRARCREKRGSCERGSDTRLLSHPRLCGAAAARSLYRRPGPPPAP